MSDFLKRAAEEQIDRDSGNTGTPAPHGGEPSGEVLDRIQNLQNDIQDLQGDVSQAVDAVHAQEGLDPDLQPMILDNLPSTEEDAITTAELAHVLNESPAAVRFALENIQRNTNIVHKHTPTEVVENENATAVREEEPEWYRSE